MGQRIYSGEIIAGIDIGTGSGKFSGVKKLGGKLVDISIPTRTTPISVEEFEAGYYDSAIRINFTECAEGIIKDKCFAVGNNAKIRAVVGESSDWRLKYDTKTYTPAYWYGLCELAFSHGIHGGWVGLRTSTCYNINIHGGIVKDLAFTKGVGEDAVYDVEYKRDDKSYHFAFVINPNGESGNIYVQETKAGLLYYRLKNREIPRNFAIIDIGFATSQIFIVADGDIVNHRDGEGGIGEIQASIERDLRAHYSIEELRNEPIGAYLRDAGQPENARRFKDSRIANDVQTLLHRNGYELTKGILERVGQGYLTEMVFAGGGGVLLAGVAGEILKKWQNEGKIKRVILPRLLLGNTNNEFANAYGALAALQTRIKAE